MLKLGHLVSYPWLHQTVSGDVFTPEVPEIDPEHPANPPASAEPKPIHPLLAKQPRYCLTCSERLPLPSGQDEPSVCEKCLRPFDPADPASFLPVPPPDPWRWWHSKEVPGVTCLLLYAAGSAAIGTLLPDWVVGIQGSGNRGRVGDAAGAIIAVFFVVFALIPWLFACVYLLLVAVEHRLRDEIVFYLAAGAIAGVVIAAGYHPILMLIGGILGTVAGLIRQARMSAGG